MKKKEINVISIVMGTMHYVPIGWTDDPEIVARVLRMNLQKRYIDLAKKMEVVSAFRVQSVYKMNSKILTTTINNYNECL